MSKPSFYWYDYETWGVNPRFDRPVQFAGIRTDQDLQVIGEPLMLYAKPAPDFLPHPQAVMVTGITPQQADTEGVPEVAFFKAIHAEFRQPGSCMVGYNSIRFDEEVTRFGFYRNFIDPYAYSWQNGNSRWDILDLMRLTHALRPAGINWPINEAGTTSFKLTDLTAANDIAQAGAHDAMVDVRATIEMARLVKQKQPKLFDFYFKLRHKRRVAELLSPLKPEPLLHVSGMFPAEQGCLAPIVPLLVNLTNANEIICYNLRFHPGELLQLDVEQIQQRLYTRTEDLPEGGQRIPLKGVHLNKSPALAPVSTLNAKQAERWQIDWHEINKHYDLLLSDPDLIMRLTSVYGAAATYETVDADVALYEGFISQQDRLTANQLLTASPAQLKQWPEDSFQDKRLNTLLFRYRARNFPQTLDQDELLRWQNFCQSRLLNGEFGARMTIAQFQQQLTALAQTEPDHRTQTLLAELSAWLQCIGF